MAAAAAAAAVDGRLRRRGGVVVPAAAAVGAGDAAVSRHSRGHPSSAQVWRKELLRVIEMLVVEAVLEADWEEKFRECLNTFLHFDALINLQIVDYSAYSAGRLAAAAR